MYGIACCAVTFGETSIPVEWHIIAGSCETIISGDKALQLGIIHFTQKADTFQPILMINKHTKGKDQDSLQKILADYPQNFTELGKLQDHQVKLHVDPMIKPVTVPPRPVPYNLKEGVDKAIKEMIDQDVIEEQTTNKPAPWISCAAIAQSQMAT